MQFIIIFTNLANSCINGDIIVHCCFFYYSYIILTYKVLCKMVYTIYRFNCSMLASTELDAYFLPVEKRHFFNHEHSIMFL